MLHVGQIALAVLTLALAAGCSTSSSARPAGSSSSAAPSGHSAAGTTCGTSYTAARVLVRVVVPGAADCAVALRVQGDYTRKVASGKAPGNGGGGPVSVDGWTCEGYPTPRVLQTGQASECHRGSIEFFAVLPAPNGSAPNTSAPNTSAPNTSAPNTSATH